MPAIKLARSSIGQWDAKPQRSPSRNIQPHWRASFPFSLRVSNQIHNSCLSFYCCLGTTGKRKPLWVPYNHYMGADKSLARPGRKQVKVSVRMMSISFGALPCKKKKCCWQFASRCWNRARPWHTSEVVSFLIGLRIYQHPGNDK